MNERVRTCPCCGHPLPSDDVVRAIKGRKRRKLYELVRDAGQLGISVRVLMDKLYADDPSGGPHHHSVISVLAQHHINPVIAQFGLKLVCGSGGGRVYRLKEIAMTEVPT
jgi:hypothetical protein